MLPEAKVDYTAPEKYGTVTVRNATSEEAKRVADQALEEYFRFDNDVRRYGFEGPPQPEEDGVLIFHFFVFR